MQTIATSRQTPRVDLAWPLPTGRILAVVDHWSDAADALRIASPSGQVRGFTVSGPTGATSLRDSLSKQPWLARLVSHLNGEDDIATRLADEVDAGATVVMIDGAGDGAVETLRRFGARQVQLIGRWSRSA